MGIKRDLKEWGSILRDEKVFMGMMRYLQSSDIEEDGESHRKWRKT